ncbi:hypothetical protein [Bacillus mobilis]
MNNFEFTDRGHAIAKEEVYTEYFGKKTDEILFKPMRAYDPNATTFEKKLDIEYAVDLQTGMQTLFQDDMGYSFSGIANETFQERFVRNMANGITITVQTGKGNPAELYKLKQVSTLLFAEFNEDKNVIADWIIIEYPKQLVQAIFKRSIYFERRINKRNGSVFIWIPIWALDASKIVYMRKGKNNLLH